jgi:hypothetical protein
MASPDKPAAKILVELPGIEPGAISCRGCGLLSVTLLETERRAYICVKWPRGPRIWEPDLPRLAVCLAAEKAATIAETAVKVAEAMREYVTKG